MNWKIVLNFRVKLTIVLFGAIMFLLFSMQNIFGELSSKAKKAEKLLQKGDITEAVEIYNKLIDTKKPDLVKEGKEGIAKTMLIKAKNEYAKKNYAEAKKILEDLAKDYQGTSAQKDSDAVFADTLYQIGIGSLENKNYMEAKVCFEKIQTISESKSDIYKKASQGIVKIILVEAEESFSFRKYQEVIEKCQKALDLISKEDPLFLECQKLLNKTADSLFQMAEDSIKNWKYEDALKILQDAVSLSSEEDLQVKCKYNMGLCYRMSGQYEKALPIYQEIINKYKKSPVLPLVYNDMYLIYIKQADKQKALKIIELAVTIEPENTDYLFKEAGLLKDTGAKNEAQKKYEKLLSLLQAEERLTFINKEEIQYRLGEVYLNLGKYVEAGIEFNKALTRNSNLIEAKKGLAMAQFLNKNYDAAIKTYGELIKQLSDEFNALQDKFSKDKNSLDLAKQIEKYRKEIAFFHYQNGLLHEQAGDYEKALEECRLGFEGVTTQAAAETLNRIRSLIQNQKKSIEK